MGSGWVLQSVNGLLVTIHEVTLYRGGGNTKTKNSELPKNLKNKTCVINIESSGKNDCFMCAVLAITHPATNNKERLKQYLPHVRTFDFSCLTYPVNATQFQKFEKVNQDINLWVHDWDKDLPHMIYRTSEKKRQYNVHILIYKEHYLQITNLALYTEI